MIITAYVPSMEALERNFSLPESSAAGYGIEWRSSFCRIGGNMRTLSLIIAAAFLADLRADAQPVTTSEQAEKLEASLQDKPGDQGARMRLLYYYHYSTNLPAAKAIETRRRHILWLIRNQPDNNGLNAPMGIILAKGGRLADPDGYLEAAKLWREQAGKSNAKAAALTNAAEFFKINDRDAALKILEEATKRYPDHPGLGNFKGTLYAMTITGASTVDQYGRPTGFPKDPLQAAESLRARKELELVEDANVLIGAAASIAMQYYEFYRDNNAAAHELFKIGEACAARAFQKLPDNIQLQAAISNLYTAEANISPAMKDKARLLEKAVAMITNPVPRSTLLATLAEAHFNNRQYDAAALDSEEILKIVSENSKSKQNYGSAIHDANTILGRVALKRENPAEAKQRLIAAGRVPASPVMMSFGPKWTLAQDLLSAGERDAVLDYIAQCKGFWKNKDDLLDGWAESIRSGSSPDFSRRTAPTASLVGAIATPFRLKDLSGREHSLEEYKGKVVLLDFWATWCAPCRTEMPTFEKLHRELKGKDAVILAVDVGENEEIVARYIDKEKFTFPVLLAEHGEMPNKYNVSAYPTLVVIDKNGRIAETLVGGRSEPELRAAIDRGRAGAPMLKEAPVKRNPMPVAGASAPVPVSPPDGAVFNHLPRTTQLTWEPVAGAIGYVVEWDYKESGGWWSESHNSQITKLATDTMFSFDFIGAQPGRWRVWAVLSGGGTGAKSEWREFRYTR